MSRSWNIVPAYGSSSIDIVKMSLPSEPFVSVKMTLTPTEEGNWFEKRPWPPLLRQVRHLAEVGPVKAQTRPYASIYCSVGFGVTPRKQKSQGQKTKSINHMGNKTCLASPPWILKDILCPVRSCVQPLDAHCARKEKKRRTGRLKDLN